MLSAQLVDTRVMESALQDGLGIHSGSNAHSCLRWEKERRRPWVRASYGQVLTMGALSRAEMHTAVCAGDKRRRRP
eukprot:882625-Rhodomonas_salina.3